MHRALADPEQADQGHADDTGTSAPRSRLSPWLISCALGVVVSATRFGFAAHRRIFHLVPDEAGTLAMARWLSGGTDWNMFRNSTWQPGLSVLLAPVYVFPVEPEHVYRAGLVLIAAVAGFSAVVLAAVANRITTFGPWGCAAVSAAVALTPSSLSATSYLWAESLVTLTFLGALLLLMRYFDQPSLLRGVAAISVAAAGFLCHGRLLPLIVLTAAAVVSESIRSSARWRAAALIALSIALILVIVRFSTMIFDQLWVEPNDTNTSRSTIARLTNPTAVVDAFLGQVWYQLVASAGLFGVGFIVAVKAIRARGQIPRDCRLLLSLTLPLMVVSAVFMSDRDRGDMLIYGRYNDAIVWPLLVLGIACVLRRCSFGLPSIRHVLATVLAAMAATGAFVEWRHGEMIDRVGVTRPMVAGLIAYTEQAFAPPIIPLTGVACALLGVLYLIAQWPDVYRRELLIAGVAAMLLFVGGLRTHEGLAVLLNSGRNTASAVEVRSMLAPNETIGIRFALGNEEPRPKITPVAQNRRAHYYQFYIDDHPFEMVEGDVALSDFRLIVAPVDDPVMLAAGATAVWQDPVVLLAFWHMAETVGD